MYGGLFGDLPAAKNSKKEDDKQRSLSLSSAPQPKHVQHPAAVPGLAEAVASSPLPVEDSSKKANLNSKSAPASKSFVAFVPTAALRRSNPNKGPLLATTPAAAITSTISKQQASEQEQTQQKEPEKASSSNEFEKQKEEPTVAVHVRKRGDDDKAQQQPSISSSSSSNTPGKGGSSSSSSSNSNLNNDNSRYKYGDTANPIQNEDDNYIDVDEDSGPLEDEQEEERQRRILHERAAEDPYDPLVPNDLQQYLELKALQAEREALERQRLEALQQQQEVISRVQWQQQQPISVTADAASAGRGRGRGGLSNLPAWMASRNNDSSINNNPKSEGVQPVPGSSSSSLSNNQDYGREDCYSVL